MRPKFRPLKDLATSSNFTYFFFILFSSGDFKFSSLSERLELLVRFFLFDVINIRIFQLSMICKKRNYGERPNTRLLTSHTSTQSPKSAEVSIRKINFMQQFMSIYNSVKKFKLKASSFDIQGDLVRN